ncbi:MAG: tRNA (guanosine(37)-N1)-methyltransferase TrmD [Puniceicoccales bacterium]|jgi:tRNA (guanine37-N1)-methyltransferase|nr:tRNA (guanosine(37)-N1)-methyltransferase TrmD [Puniceicoccales bacterium]
MRIDLLTLFPGMVGGFFSESILGRAVENGLLNVAVHDIRDWSQDRHQRVDDTPFGGGAGMLMSPQPLFDAIEAVRTPGCQIVYLCPDGEPLSNALARSLSAERHLVLVSGHYEGIDQRVRDALITREISIGDYVLTNGTLAAVVLVDCLARQIPGVLGEENSLTGDSFTGSLLAFPQYTRPADFRGMMVPPVLLSGDHGAIAKWRHEQQALKTQSRRPDLFQKQTKNT